MLFFFFFLVFELDFKQHNMKKKNPLTIRTFCEIFQESQIQQYHSNRHVPKMYVPGSYKSKNYIMITE